MHNPLSLNNLNAFVAAAQHSSFQEAARALFVTPSAVSHQVRNLEKILGYKLFDRLDKGVRLSARGETLFAEVQLPIRQLHEASRRALRGLADNSLALSVAPAFATGWLLPRLGDFYRRYPEINLSVVATTELIDFSSDPFDAAIRMGSGQWQKTRSVRLFDSEIVAICRPSLLGRNASRLSAAEIRAVVRVQNASLPDQWPEWFRSAGVEAPPGNANRIAVQSSAQVIESVLSGDCVGLVDRNFIAGDIDSGRLVLACDHVLRGEGGYFLTFPPASEQRPPLQRFEDWLKSQLAG